MGRRLLWGAALLSLRPIYVLVELLVAAATMGGYDLSEDTVSQLGAVECTPEFCSPRHELINGTFVIIGVLLAAGSGLLVVWLGRAVAVLLVLAGLSSVATGLTPVDGEATLHAVAAAPLFVCQPLALLLLGRRLWTTHRWLAIGLLLTGSIAAGAAVGFVVTDARAGLLERLALWPVLLALAAVAAVLARSGRDQVPAR